MRACVLLLAGLTLAGCSEPAPTHSLLLAVRTDLVPGVEFEGVRVERMVSDDPSRVAGRVFLVATQDDNFLDAPPTVTLAGLKTGSHRLHVAVLNRSGEAVLGRTLRYELRGNAAVTIVLTRDCRDVACDQTASDGACHGGRCVDEGCSEASQERCGAVECTVDAECTVQAMCARAFCADGTCLVASRAGGCPSDEWCHPELGCRPLTLIAQQHAGDGGGDGPITSPPFDAGLEPDSGGGGRADASDGPDANDTSGPDAGQDAAGDSGDTETPACRPETCNGADDDCDSRIDEDEGDLCPGAANAPTGYCAAGVCWLACAAGFGDCNLDAVDGCEVDFATDADHCGGCGDSCGGGTCVDGACTPAQRWVVPLEPRLRSLTSWGAVSTHTPLERLRADATGNLYFEDLPCGAELASRDVDGSARWSVPLPVGPQTCAQLPAASIADGSVCDCTADGSRACDPDCTPTSECSNCWGPTGGVARVRDFYVLPTGESAVLVEQPAGVVTLAPPWDGWRSAAVAWVTATGASTTLTTIANMIPSRVTADDSGNVYLAGTYFHGTRIGSPLASRDDNGDGFIASYGPGGALRWVVTFGAVDAYHPERVFGMAVVGGDRLLVVGSTPAGTQLGLGAPFAQASTFVAGFHATTGAHQWTHATADFGRSGDMVAQGTSVMVILSSLGIATSWDGVTRCGRHIARFSASGVLGSSGCVGTGALGVGADGSVRAVARAPSNVIASVSETGTLFERRAFRDYVSVAAVTTDLDGRTTLVARRAVGFVIDGANDRFWFDGDEYAFGSTTRVMLQVAP